MSRKTSMADALRVYCRLEKGSVRQVLCVSNITRFKQRLERDGLEEFKDFLAVTRGDQLVITKISDRNPIINVNA